MDIPKKKILRFRQFIFSWWKTNRRDLPWRRTHDPYKILVSEIMLQQTQVPRVIPKYTEFLEAFPTGRKLAQAPTSAVIKVWKGMGYNRRALYLKRAAQEIVERYGGKFPKSEKELIKLSGLGTYTARAILVFAYKKNVGAVDTNIRHIITHFFFDDIPQKEKVIQEAADRLVPIGKSWEWHQALMDYGALELKKINPPDRRAQKHKPPPFKESNRFFRGRIIDRLREGPAVERTLVEDFIKAYKKDREFFRTMLVALMKDGLVMKSGTRVRLPE